MFLGTLASQFGPQAKAAALGDRRNAATRFHARSKKAAGSFAAAVCGSGQARDLFAHGGRAEPTGAFRPQTRIDQARWPGLSRVVSGGQALCLHQWRAQTTGSQYPFHQAGNSGQWISDRMPHLEKHIDDLCFIKSMRTDQFNHAPAQLLVQTGNRAPRAILRSVPGCSMDSAPRIRICPVSSCCSRGASAGWRQATVGLGLSAQCLSGRAMPLAWRTCALPGKPSASKPSLAAQHAGCR